MKTRWQCSFVAMAGLACAAVACSNPEGGGQVTGTLSVPGCWTGPFDLKPDFFAAYYYRDNLQLRFQRGSDNQNFSDGVSMHVSDVGKIREKLYAQPLVVGLPPEVTPAGVPIKPTATPPLVSFALYLQSSCKAQTVTLFGVDSVTITADGTCNARPVAGADPADGCKGTQGDEVGDGHSHVAFQSLYNGDEEASARDRLIKGCFDIYLADPREIAADGKGPAPICRGHVRGTFDYFFERGRPAQPFP